MHTRILTTLLSILAFTAQAQVIGGRSNSEMTPKVAEPAKITSGGFAGDVNLFTGSYGAAIPMGSVSTPGGLAWNLSLNYNSSFTVGGTQPIATGIPYGEGWSLNLPTISVETEAFNNFRYQQYCQEDNNITLTKLDFSAPGTDAGKEGDLYWYAPYVDIPGVANGRAIFKYIDVDDDHAAVFVLNCFETQVELRFNQEGWRVIVADGTQYFFSPAVQITSFTSPANRRVLHYDQDSLGAPSPASAVLTDSTGYGMNASIVENSISPKTSYNNWYCTRIDHRNLPGQSIQFTYKLYGAFNYFQEFEQEAYAYAALQQFGNTTFAADHNYTAYSDILLERIESASGYSTVNVLKLNYATNKSIINGNPELIPIFTLPGETGRLDSLYSFESVYTAGVEEDFETGWKRYEHVKKNSSTATGGVNPGNPYLYGSNYVRADVVPEEEIAFDHSFLETPRIATGLSEIIPGDIYEVRTKLKRSRSTGLQIGNGTLDLAVVSGNLNNPDGTDNPSYDLSNYNTGIYYPGIEYQKTRGIPLFSTFNMALKWTLSYGEAVKETSNFFVMPNIPSKFGGINIQIGPGNSDIDAGMDLATPGFLLGSVPQVYNAYPFKTSSYALKSAAGLPSAFGLGLPWGMMIPIYKSMITSTDVLTGSGDDPDIAFQSWHNDPNSGLYAHPNEPTKLDASVRLDELELIRYSKNPYLLTSVEQYTVNGETGYTETDGYKLTARKVLEHTFTRERIMENYAYGPGDTIRYKNMRQVRILLKAVREIPVAGATDTTKQPATFMSYSDYTSPAQIYDVTEPLNGYTGKVLTRFTDHLGGITDIDYYPVTDPRTYYSNRFQRTLHCDAVVTSPAYGLSSATEVHPVVQYILKNDEQDLVKNHVDSTNSSHKRWHYDFADSTKVHKQIYLNNYDPRFHHGRKSAYDIGFRKVNVYGPTLTEGGKSYVNKTTYEHYGYTLTAGVSDSTIEDYLYHGKLRSIRQYDVNNQLFEEQLISYAYTEAFRHGYTRPDLYRKNIVKDQLEDNPGGTYEYRDYYLNLALSVTAGAHTYTGTAAYDHLEIPVFTGSNGTMEQPRFLDFYFYDSLARWNPAYLLNSYFIKKTEEISRTYDDYLYKQAITSGTFPPEVVSPNPNPFGTGHVNPVIRVPLRDNAYLYDLANEDAAYVTDELLRGSPLSDTVLEAIITSANLSGIQKAQLLLEQPRLSNATWIQLAQVGNKIIPPADLILLTELQPYFTDDVLVKACEEMDSGWDDKVVSTLFLRNEYLSYPVLLAFTDTAVAYISPGNFATILAAQPQLPEDILIRTVTSPFLSPSNLSKMLAHQVLTEDVYTAINGNSAVTNTTLVEIIETRMSFPTESTFLELLGREFSETDLMRILTVINRDLTGPEITALNAIYKSPAFLSTFSYTGNPLDQFCNGAIFHDRSYIETKTVYEYYDADYRGVSDGRAYKVLMGLEDIPSRTVSLTDVFGSGGTRTISKLRLKHEPSWQLFSKTTTSPHLPTAKNEEQYFYLYDLRNRYDRYWYNYDVNTIGTNLSSFSPVITGPSNSDTVMYTSRWENGYETAYGNGTPELPKYDGMVKSRQYNLRSTPFQKTIITKSPRGERELQRSEYYFYDARWVFDADIEAVTREYDGPSCPGTGTPEPDPTGCAACLLFKEGTEQQLLQQLPNGFCLWEDAVTGYYACPYGVNAAACFSNADLIDCHPTLGVHNEDPEKTIKPGDLLKKTLQLRSTVVQVDTIAGRPNHDFGNLRFDRSNSYIADFHILYSGTDANGYARPYRMLYPFDTLTTNTIHSRNEHLQPALVSDAAGLRTRYYYDKALYYWNVDTNCSNGAYFYNYNSFRVTNIGLPVRVTVGYGRADSLSTTFAFTDAGQVKKVTSPSGHFMEYTFDGFHRLDSVTENGTRLLSANDYSQWNHNSSLSFGQRTDQNYVLSVLWNSADSTDRELQKAFIDPLGRTAGVLRAYGAGGTHKIYSGSVTYDNWGRVTHTRKPFSQHNAFPLDLQNNLGTPYVSVTRYDPDPASLAVRASNYGVAITDTHTVRTSTAIANYIFVSCELGLSNQELQELMRAGSTSGFRFLRSSVTDQDHKETVTYTNAFGQKVATLAWSSLNEKIVTLFIYDDYGNLSKTINPARQATTYLYNILGQVVKETSTDAGTKRYLYNRRGLVSAIQDETDRASRNSSNILAPKYRRFSYDSYGKPTEQALITTSYHNDVFCFANSSVGATGAYVTDANGPNYFRYTFSNRSSQDWLVNYSTLDAAGTTVTFVSGLPSGTVILEKTTDYGGSSATPSLLGKVKETKSYSLAGVAVQKISYSYDERDLLAAQVIRQHPVNEALNDSKTVKATITYAAYNYRGSLTEQRLDMGSDGTTELQYFYTFDALNRLAEVRAAQGAVAYSAATPLAAYRYDDERGTVDTVNYTINGSGGLVDVQSVAYVYDERDRLKVINSELFRENLFYDAQNPGAAVLHDQNWNGNVNGTLMQYNFSGASNPVTGFDLGTTYGYRYDRLNRLVQADATVGDYVALHAGEPEPANGYRIGDERMTYDRIGNLLTLLRVKPGTVPGTGLAYDDFIYTYASGKNLLTTLNGLSGTPGRSYSYDANGNMKTDSFRGISATTYGRSSYAYNLTKGADTISYLYDAADMRMYKKTKAPAQTKEEMYITDAAGHTLVVADISRSSPAYEYFVFGTERIARITDAGGATPAKIYADEATFFLYDHLGNTRVSYTVSNSAVPAVVYAGDYYPYGKVLREFDNGDGDRYLTTHHERDKETGLDYRGARYYDSDVGRFLSTDPWQDKYPAWSTYNYVMGNPIIFTDPTGKGVESTDVKKNANGTYTVVGGDINDGDLGIYVVDDKGVRTGEKIGETMTYQSFYYSETGEWKGVIDPTDKTGINFINDEIIGSGLGVVSYMMNATGGGKFDFKRTGTKPGDKERESPDYHYRGMLFDGIENRPNRAVKTFASARDVGNFAAGFMAGSTGASWVDCRTGFDALETYQNGSASYEGSSTQKAEYVGWYYGNKAYKRELSNMRQNQMDRVIPFGPK